KTKAMFSSVLSLSATARQKKTVADAIETRKSARYDAILFAKRTLPKKRATRRKNRTSGKWLTIARTIAQRTQRRASLPLCCLKPIGRQKKKNRGPRARKAKKAKPKIWEPPS